MADLKVGDPVTLVDERGVERAALVQAIHNPTYINVVIVSPDEARHDSYGRQVEHYTSVPMKSAAVSAGRHFYVPGRE